MRIATWNVNSLRTRLEHMARWLDTARPDVLLLQETKVENGLFPHQVFTSRGYHLAVHGQKSYNGVCVASLMPLADIIPGFEGEDLAGHARLLSATVQAPSGPVRVVSAYVPNGGSTGTEKFAFKENFYRHLTELMKTAIAAHPRLILGGDFNIAADERDVHDPARWSRSILFTPEERAWLAAFRQETNLHDALRCVSEESGLYSWWDYRAGAVEKNHGLRIDYLFVTEALQNAVTRVDHDRAERTQPQPSDHIPVVATLDI